MKSRDDPIKSTKLTKEKARSLNKSDTALSYSAQTRHIDNQIRNKHIEKITTTLKCNILDFYKK